VALRQALISLLSIAIRDSSATGLLLRAGVENHCVEISVSGKGAVPSEAFDSDESLQVARRLLESCGGTVNHATDRESFTIHIRLPGLQQRPVLVVEDNPDAIRLLQRYVEGTRYRVVGAGDVGEALSHAAEDRPAVIVLDVMMPDVDGWESLSRFRLHPLTSGVPLLISTILPEEELAMSLGACGFLRKPFARREFLRALDRACLEERVS
jgi:CheY-like chemotaxis protein